MIRILLAALIGSVLMVLVVLSVWGAFVWGMNCRYENDRIICCETEVEP